MTNLDSISKSRAIAYKVPSIQIYDFSSTHVWIWELDNKKGWEPKNGAFELWCWRRLLIVPWTARGSNQSILKEIYTEYSLEGLMLKLKLQGFCHLMWRADTLEKPLYWERLRAGGEGVSRGWDGGMTSTTQWTWVWAISGRSEGQGSLSFWSPWGHNMTRLAYEQNRQVNKRKTDRSLSTCT